MSYLKPRLDDPHETWLTQIMQSGGPRKGEPLGFIPTTEERERDET